MHEKAVTAPTLEQVQRDREFARNVIRKFCDAIDLNRSPDQIETVTRAIVQLVAPLPEPEQKTARGHFRNGDLLEYRRLVKDRWQYRQVLKYGQDDWGDLSWTDEVAVAVASLLPENATPAAQPAPTPRTFTLEEIGDAVIKGALNYSLSRDRGVNINDLKAEITRALTDKEGA